MARREQHGMAGLNPQPANRATDMARADDTDAQLAITYLREGTQRPQRCEQGQCAACAKQRTARVVKALLLPHRELLVSRSRITSIYPVLGPPSHQIADHHSEVTALGLVAQYRFGRGFGRCRSDRIMFGDRAQNFAAMPQQNAEVLEILLCQIADDREINGVV